jgi:hypothetical protein
MEAVVGGVTFIGNALIGIQAFNSRSYTISVQKHKSVTGFYRAIIETTSAYKNVKNGRVLIISNFVSFENGLWREHAFNFASSR